MRGALARLNLTENDTIKQTIELSGVVPESVIHSDIKKEVIVLGITPNDFIKDYSAIEFDFKELCKEFAKHCKDFNDDLVADKPSRALEFSAKILFEVGPYIRNEKKSKGDKAVRFRFPYVKENSELSIHTVIVSTFRENVYTTNTGNDKTMVVTFKQAGILAMITFDKMIKLAYSSDSSVLMTPLCGAVYSRDSIKQIAGELNMHEVDIIQMINASTATGGQYLHNSDIACAIVSIIATTKRVANKDVRHSMITKTIKQYTAQHKKYESKTFNTLAKYALGGVPQGMDSETLIDNFTNIQTYEVNLRTQALVIKQSETRLTMKGLQPYVPAAKDDDADTSPDVKTAHTETSGRYLQTPGGSSSKRK